MKDFMNIRLDSINSIEDIIENLSDEEKELHHELIVECRKREVQTIQAGITTRNNIIRLGNAAFHIISNLEKIYRTSQNLEQDSINTKNRIMENKLRNMPDDKFFNA
jgi:hypothetical protein